MVDPRYTPTARLADDWIRFNPSTHIALVNSMMYWIIKEGMQDKEFIEKRTKGFEDLKKTVEKYADVEHITGVPPEKVKEIAFKYAAAKNAVIIYCLGITELTTGTDNVRSLGNLSMLCGNIGRPGVGVNPLRGQNNVQGACDMGAYPNVYSGYQKCEVPENRAKMEKPGVSPELPDWYGVTLTEQITQCGDPIKAMYILGLNPVVSYPDSNHVKRSLDKLDFLVVQDIFWTESLPVCRCRPARCLLCRKGRDLHERRAAHQPCPQGRRPPGEAKADWEIFVMLAKKMGLKGFDFKSAKDVWDDMRACTPSMFGATYERMDKPESIHWPCPTIEHPGTPILHKEKFSSADGLGTFFGLEYRPPAEVADAEYPFTLMTGRLIFHYHTRTQTGRCQDAGLRSARRLSSQINTEDAKRTGHQERREDQVAQPPRRSRYRSPR